MTTIEIKHSKDLKSLITLTKNATSEQLEALAAKNIDLINLYIIKNLTANIETVQRIAETTKKRNIRKKAEERIKKILLIYFLNN